MKKNILFLILIFIANIEAKECYQQYRYIDNHKIKTTINSKLSNQKVTIDAQLHIRYLEDNGSLYNIFWLEKGIQDKRLINKDDIYSPFIVRNIDFNGGFIARDIKSLSNDSDIENRLIGIIELLQLKPKSGIYQFINSMGSVEVNQTIQNSRYYINHIKQHTKNISNNVKYLYSKTELILDKGCSIWKEINTKQKIQINIPMLKSNIINQREFKLLKSNKRLDNKHWFFNLSTNISTWGFDFNKTDEIDSLEEALNNFDKKEKEILAILNNSNKLEKWVKNNIDFLSYLNLILESKKLDDNLSKTLFAKLGYIDSIETTKILSKVILNKNIDEKERFRGLMGLKNSSAPIDLELMDDIIAYGLDDKNSDDFIKNSTGMILGSLARERLDRNPEQYYYISDAIIDAINSSSDKMVSLASAGNMLTTAPDKLIDVVDNILSNTDNISQREQSAKALIRIKKSNLSTKLFQSIVENEINTDTKEALIRASEHASDFNSNTNYHTFLTDLIKDKKEESKSRVASLDILKKTDFGKSVEDKKDIRELMIGEQDSTISKRLRELYRR